MTSGRLLLCLAAVCALLAEVRAAPLDADTCAKLAIEHGELERAGIDKEMAKGPEWGKANLAPGKLAQVRRFIELEELILFRCRGKTLVTLPPDPEPPATADQDKQEAESKPDKQGKEPPADKAAKPAPAAHTKNPAAAAKQKTETGRKAAASPGARPEKQEAAKKSPRAKVDDAYKAPPPDPSVNPFANQLQRQAR